MYYTYGISGPSLLIESVDSMIIIGLSGDSWININPFMSNFRKISLHVNALTVALTAIIGVPEGSIALSSWRDEKLGRKSELMGRYKRVVSYTRSNINMY